jgi:hypothetical protein
MNTSPRLTRHGLILRVQRSLERDAFPRLQMCLIVSLTGAAGFLASYLLRIDGFDTMWSRYALAMGAAYLVFLGLLWVWIKTKADDFCDAAELVDLAPDLPLPNALFRGGGGSFDGAGASADFAAGADGAGPGDGATEDLGKALGAVGDADELAVPLAVVLLIGALVAAVAFFCFSVIYTAPVLLAELMVDGLLSVSLYKRMKLVDSQHWLQSALRRTILPFLVTMVIVAACGWGLALYAPGAHSIGEVLQYVKQPH